MPGCAYLHEPGGQSPVDGGFHALRLDVESEPGVTQIEMIEAVKAHLPGDLFPGGAKAGWWAKSVQLDLEAKKIIVREKITPLRWHRNPDK